MGKGFSNAIIQINERILTSSILILFAGKQCADAEHQYRQNYFFHDPVFLMPDHALFGIVAPVPAKLDTLT